MADLSNVDLTTLDLSDEETMKFVHENMDLDDPETNQYVQTQVDPIGAATGTPYSREVKDAPKQSTWDRRLEEAQGERPGLDSDNNLGNTYGPADMAARAVEYGMAANNTVLEGMDSFAERSGLADLPSAIGIDQKLLPGSMIGAIQEAFPLGGLEGGLLPNGTGVKAFRDAKTMEAGNVPASMAEPFKMAPEAEAKLSQMYETASIDEINAFAKENGSTLDQAQLKKYIEYRDANKGEKLRTDVLYETPEPELPFHYEPRQMEMDLSPPKKLEDTLAEEAKAFRQQRAPEPTAENFFKSTEEQLEMELPQPKGQMSFHFDTPEKIETFTKTVDEHLSAVDQAWRDTTADWMGAPDFEVVRSVNDITDPELLASIQSEGINPHAAISPSGKVTIIAENVTPDQIPAIAFHEGLGHHGMTKLFQEGLDAKLESMYDSSSWFKGKVDDWMESNPGAYGGDIARAADEVLAEMSELGPRDIKGREVMMNNVKNYIKQTARNMGMKLEYSPREIESILDMAHDAVINGKDGARANGFRFSRGDMHDEAVQKTAELFGIAAENIPQALKEADFRGQVFLTKREMELTRRQEGGSRYKRSDTKKSVTGEKMQTKRDFDDLLTFVGKETEGWTKGPTSVVETARAADDMNLTASKYLRGKSLADQNVSAMIHGAKQLLTDQAEALAGLSARAEKEGLTPSIKAMIHEKLATVKAVYARFDEDTGEIGRSLRQLREITQSKALGKEVNRFLGETDGIAILGNEEATMRFLKNIQNINEVDGSAGVVAHMKAVQKAHVEDYLGSVVYNMMLSSPKTWAFNFVGSPLNIVMDLGADIPRIGSKGGRAEVAARVHGHLAALAQAETWKTTFQSFKDGRSDGIGLEGKTGQKDLIMSTSSNPAVKAAGMVVETPQRVMAATDQFWSNVAHMGNMYGEAAREAALETNSKAAYAQKFAEYLETPTEAMRERAERMTNRQLFRDHDEMSKGARKLTESMKPRYEDAIEILYKEEADENGKLKMTPIKKNVKDKNTAVERAVKFGVRLAIPFVPTIDSIARTIIRNSGPTALFSKAIREDLKAGGVRRSSAVGRIGVATAVMSQMWAMAENGDLTGLGDPDWKKQETRGATRPPMSVRIGGTWYSYRGFDPLAGQLAAMATAHERAGGKGLSPEAMGGFISGTAAAMAQSSYAEPVSKFAKMLGETTETVTKGEPVGPALTNFIGGNIGTVTNPAFLRWLDTQIGDGIKKDVTGDDSFTDKVLGRATDHNMIFDAIAEKEAPSKHDVYGRPVKDSLDYGLMSTRSVETNPAILEMDRLESLSESPVIGAVSATAKIDGVVGARLNSQQYQDYQRISGERLVEVMNQVVELPAYQAMPDEEKVEEVRKLRDEIRKEVREELFPDPEDEEEEE